MIGRCVAGLLALALLSPAAFAGPCTDRIYQFDLALAKRLDAAAAAGRSGAETQGALLHHQPTPSSVAGAEAKLGDISEANLTAINEAMEDARKADDAGDLAGCERALAKADDMFHR